MSFSQDASRVILGVAHPPEAAPRLESIANDGCPVCGTLDHDPHEAFGQSDVRGWRVVTCVDCGLNYTFPRPADGEWGEHYPRDYVPHHARPAQGREVLGWKRAITGLVLRGRAVSYVDGTSAGWIRAAGGMVLGPRLYPVFGMGRLLDVGCGADRYLSRMRALGWRVEGVDRSPLAAEEARDAYGVDVAVSEVPGPNIPRGPFDLVTMWQALEHLEAPREALEAMRDCLAPGGRLVVSVPNAASWSARRFGTEWIGWDVPRHIVHFTPDTLARILESAGFDVVRMETIGHTAWVRRSGCASGIFRRRIVASLASRLAVWRNAGDSLVAVAKVWRRRNHGA